MEQQGSISSHGIGCVVAPIYFRVLHRRLHVVECVLLVCPFRFMALSRVASALKPFGLCFGVSIWVNQGARETERTISCENAQRREYRTEGCASSTAFARNSQRPTLLCPKPPLPSSMTLSVHASQAKKPTAKTRSTRIKEKKSDEIAWHTKCPPSQITAREQAQRQQERSASSEFREFDVCLTASGPKNALR